jgi:hypothetical protein
MKEFVPKRSVDQQRSKNGCLIATVAFSCALFGLWMFSFSGMFGLATAGGDFSDRVVTSMNRNVLCAPLPGTEPLGAGGIYRLSSVEKVVSVSSGDPRSLYYLATPSTRPDGSSCTNLRLIGEDRATLPGQRVDYANQWGEFWFAAEKRVYAAHGGERKGPTEKEWGRMVFAEFCKSEAGRLRSPDWCRDGLAP